MGELHVNFCERWTADGPAGRCRCLGIFAADEVPAAVQRGWYDSVRGGWGPGIVVVTDANGDLVA